MTGDPPPDAQDVVWSFLKLLACCAFVLIVVPYVLGLLAIPVVFFFKVGFRSL